jgi:hypothetical protein
MLSNIDNGCACIKSHIHYLQNHTDKPRVKLRYDKIQLSTVTYLQLSKEQNFLNEAEEQFVWPKHEPVNP